MQSVGAGLGPGLGSWMLLVLVGGAWAGFMALAVLAAVLVWGAHATAGSRGGARSHEAALGNDVRLP
ncbi:hypothetical protein JOF28_000075 [Leucobacter exalbidus]|uniref:Uncharacterized protein n=1 Tax=Leucobacter exalbidus TaxID=662960 RepID=A0A940T2I6_9MICO|nr:hypothetical protein [Leucobacter exalbidus]MBP1324843.1 hypothetical protein [Leucobacter exalbidus]